MYKVVIVDDEEVILQGLKKMIHWEDFEMEIVGVATDGQKAFEVICETQPDLVISDIKMPKMSGLQLMKTVIDETELRTKFVFVSAYQEFDYVKEALSGGAVDYLLKPVRKADLEKVLEKCIGKMQDESAVAMLKESSDKVDIQNLFKNVNDGYEYAENDLYKQFSELNLDISDKFMVGLCFGILPEDASIREQNYEKYMLIKFSVYDKIRELFMKNKQGFVIRKDDSCCNLIGIFDKSEKELFTQNCIIPIKRQIEELYPIRLCVGIGSRVYDLSEAKQAYQKARAAYDLYFFEEKEIIDISLATRERHQEFEGVEEFNALTAKVFSNIAAKSSETLDSVRDVLELIRQMHYGAPTTAVNQCLVFFSRLLEELHSYDMVRGSYSEAQEEMLTSLREFPTFRQVEEYLMDYYEHFLQEIYATVQKKDVAIIVEVKDYLHKNYMNEISLKDLADMVCVSPSYFSTFFKNTTGENYKSYLIKIRMEEALKLVMNTDLKTYEIAEQVGYNNVRRFVDAFKNRYDMSPMDYRKLYKKTTNNS